MWVKVTTWRWRCIKSKYPQGHWDVCSCHSQYVYQLLGNHFTQGGDISPNTNDNLIYVPVCTDMHIIIWGCTLKCLRIKPLEPMFSLSQIHIRLRIRESVMGPQCHLAVQSGLILVLLPGWKSLPFLSTRRQTEGKSSSESNRGLKHISTVYRDSEGLLTV